MPPNDATIIRFDASIALTVEMLPLETLPETVVTRVRELVEAMPGAGWISVEWCGSVPRSAEWLRLFDPGDGRERRDGAFAGIRCWIEFLVSTLLAG